MKNWLTLEPDRVKLMNKHYTKGRGGNKVECVVVHHNAGVLSIDQIWQVWQTRAASAHYQVQSDGVIGQLVWDRDTAWHAANQYTNQRSIGIEVSNSAGPNAGWPITDTAIREAGRLIAAVCLYYGLGRPVSGDNVRYHREFTSTTCPYHLAPGGKYNAALIGEAQRFYDELKAKKNGTTTGRHAKKTPAGGSSVMLTAKYFTDFIKGFFGPQIDALQDVWTQLRGPSGGGWPQLGKNKAGQNLTLVDAVAALRHDVADLTRKIDNLGGK
ncbi:N-acetylmuramoyl-L-alanine amidase [Corynebacterium lujinxingii]|uniref:N-acetylmuramoyl-L-alanine amidase n=1 Tax=Corynebacterium lujinxingii TaxID=2763010 RepID=A0A7H0K0U4_9CORY|nr:peptidoglycan recognition family protein [Corynebacterium lujinxingii]MBC3179756.1 N-acetylmuramoyl-L-alanine amidase [Corynebacterium lujinxingii]NNO10706.1 N-acetylmuramoyl-L-alanine amidase [Corynebacterium lujinxingii]QNP90910.1 N-acetylmuramoyl-L-alanine amidase [Corynebacterium lujinxingii]